MLCPTTSVKIVVLNYHLNLALKVLTRWVSGQVRHPTFATFFTEYWDTAQKGMPGVSEKSFITSLEDFSLATGRVGLYGTRGPWVFQLFYLFIHSFIRLFPLPLNKI